MSVAVQWFFELLTSPSLPLEQLGGAVFFFLLCIGLPALFGRLVAGRDWRLVRRGLMYWYGGLFALFFLMSFSLEDTVHGTLLYGMFFSIVAVPLVTLALRLWTAVRMRFQLTGRA